MKLQRRRRASVADAGDTALAEAAAHRGLKLVKSRKRKPGIGDYGHFGLTDNSGKPLLGFGTEGLVATAAEIRDYLRQAETSAWGQSADAAPDRPLRATKKAAAQPAPDSAAEQDADVAPQRQPLRRPEQESRPKPPPKAEPKPNLEIRAAAKADFGAIGRLIGSGASAAEFTLRFESLERHGGGVLVADQGGIIGCIGWDVLLSLQTAPIGRITVLVIAESQQRNGLGRALVQAASAMIAKQGCLTMEAMSDIEVRNANGFYRALGFQQTSYRFVRSERSDR